MPLPGDTFVTPSMAVTEQMRSELVRIGGFIHPIFTRPSELRLPHGAPLPGQAVLLLMGGLVEKSGKVDDAIVMLGMSDVRFRRLVVPGSHLHVAVEVLSRTPSSHGRAVCEMRWRALSNADEVVAEATVQMLVTDRQE